MQNPKELLNTLRSKSTNCVHINLTKSILVEIAVLNNEGVLSESGALIVDTGIHTGRSATDKFIVDHETKEDMEIAWGQVNKRFPSIKFQELFKKVIHYLSTRETFIQDVYAGRDPEYSFSFRFITEKAWSALFTSNLLAQINHDTIAEPDFTIIHAPDFFADTATDGTETGTFIIIDFQQKIVLIGGTSYAGEVKKSVFTVMNRLLPNRDVFPMHCSANIGKAGDTALFFGLSGTGKTTLSSSRDRFLIGDDEHGWSKNGIFNFEAGCYAKTINLNQELEPLIWFASNQFGTVLENVGYDPVTRVLDFSDCSKTENTRSAYPLAYIDGHVASGRGGHPSHIFFLSADAFGVLPPISLLTVDQAVYYFLLGYTAKLAGTEKGLGSEPQATFSACFGEPFLPLSPIRYANLLRDRIEKHRPKVWLVNTGWTGGQYGIGSRIKLGYSRAMLQAALLGEIDIDQMQQEKYFRLNIPKTIPEVPVEVLDPIKNWKDPAEYAKVAGKLILNMQKRMDEYRSQLPISVLLSGPA